MSDTEGQPIQGMFNFEGRCLVCGTKVMPPMRDGSPFSAHIEQHRQDGYVERLGEGRGSYRYRQVRAHPAGFPGILLPKELEWTK